MNKILILYDNRGYLASSLEDKSKKISISLLKKYLLKEGFNIEVRDLHQLKFPSNYNGWFVLYPSSEDNGLFYKSFIEDVLLRLQMDGAVLLPKFEYFRAHQNKAFMELCRTSLSEPYQTITSVCFYTIEELKRFLKKKTVRYPVVVKSAEGSGSLGVKLARNEKNLLAVASKMGKITFVSPCCTRKRQIRNFLGRTKRKIKGIHIIEQQPLREKIVIQTFIPDLMCDYKVLVFGEKYYLLRRYVRTGEFRASGSGKFEFPLQLTKVEKSVLEYAYHAYVELSTPMLSIDIAYDGEKCHMLEFQCMNFGPYTLQKSSAFYRREQNQWIKVEKKSILEEEMANAVAYYLQESENIDE